MGAWLHCFLSAKCTQNQLNTGGQVVRMYSWCPAVLGEEIKDTAEDCLEG